MDPIITVIVFIAVLFAAMILQLAAKPRFAAKLTSWLILICALCGFVIYGYGYALMPYSIPTSIIRGLLAVCGMFVAKVDFALVENTPLFQNPFTVFLFWLVHLFALYATASATIATIGAEALRKIRLMLARHGRLYLIYGTDEQCVDFGKTLLKREPRCAVVFIDDQPDSSADRNISRIGCVLRTDAAANGASKSFLRSVGIRKGKRRLTLYALQADHTKNLRYATRFLDSLKELDVDPMQTSLVMPGSEETTAAGLQVLGSHYGYGYVSIFQEGELAARLLLQCAPPAEQLSFDEYGCATQNFEALIIGFGQTGQAVLRNLVMNGQFAGSRFRCTVFAPDCEDVKGLMHSCAQIFQNYTVDLKAYDARSAELYDFLSQNGHKLKYIVVCTGSGKLNSEICEELTTFCMRRELSIPIHQCSREGVTLRSKGSILPAHHKLYTPETLDFGSLDRMAMVLNHYYMGKSARTAVQDWMNCDYFSRMSSRASADFIDSMLLAAGTTAADVLEFGWHPSPEMLKNLGQTEHLRWCAFHYCMGFVPMSEEERLERAARYAQGEASLRISKNLAARTHACLIDWDKLDALSAWEKGITGEDPEYRQLDYNNVLAIRDVLLAERTEPRVQ